MTNKFNLSFSPQEFISTGVPKITKYNKNQVTIDGDLNVTGQINGHTNSQSNIFPNGINISESTNSLTVDSTKVNIVGPLSVQTGTNLIETSTDKIKLTGQVELVDDLTIDKSLTVKSNTTVTGDTSITSGGNSLILNTSKLAITSPVDVTGNLTVSENLLVGTTTAIGTDNKISIKGNTAVEGHFTACNTTNSAPKLSLDDTQIKMLTADDNYLNLVNDKVMIKAGTVELDVSKQDITTKYDDTHKITINNTNIQITGDTAVTGNLTITGTINGSTFPGSSSSGPQSSTFANGIDVTAGTNKLVVDSTETAITGNLKITGEEYVNSGIIKKASDSTAKITLDANSLKMSSSDSNYIEITDSNTTFTGGATITGLLTASSGATITGGDVNIKRQQASGSDENGLALSQVCMLLLGKIVSKQELDLIGKFQVDKTITSFVPSEIRYFTFNGSTTPTVVAFKPPFPKSKIMKLWYSETGSAEVTLTLQIKDNSDNLKSLTLSAEDAGYYKEIDVNQALETEETEYTFTASDNNNNKLNIKVQFIQHSDTIATS